MGDAVKRSARALRQERLLGGELPYGRHVTDQVVALHSGALMISFKVRGRPHETAEARDLNDAHGKLNQVWRNVAHERLAVWTHLVRAPASAPPADRFQSGFAAALDAAWRERLGRAQLFDNAQYLTLVLHPGRATADRAAGLAAAISRRPRHRDIGEDLKILEDAARDLQQALAPWGVQPLGLRSDGGLWRSEPLEMLRHVLTGRRQVMPLPAGPLGDAMHGERIIFGRELLELRDVGESRFAAMLGVKDYPAATRPGLWDGLSSAPFPLAVSQSFAFLSRPAARSILERKQNQLVSARDRAASQVAGLDTALDDLVSGRFVMGEHQASVLVWASSPQALAERLSKARAVLADSGLVAAREDLGLEAAFWAQFPGRFNRRTRPAAITSLNFAALSPLHAAPAGRRRNLHWKAPVATLRTSERTAYAFNFHLGDLGHTFICGPSGSGKTVVQNFLLAQAERLGARRLLVDKDRGGELFVRACGGTYLTLRNGEATGFAPFRALEPTPANRAFLARLVRLLAYPGGEAPDPLSARAIERGVDALARLPVADRSLSSLRDLLGQKDAHGLGARLERWTRAGALGWALDNPHDQLSFDAPLAGFDMTHVLDHPEVRAPLMLYLFHRIGGLLDGSPLILDIDEFWKALGDPAFVDLARDGLKTWRKLNGVMVFGTQSPSDVLASPIAAAVLEQCATQIFLPNPHAQARDYCDGFGLNAEEFRLIRDVLTPESRRFLVKQGRASVVLELDLSGLDDMLSVLSGRAETVALLDRLRAEHGDDPAVWLAHFHTERRRL